MKFGLALPSVIQTLDERETYLKEFSAFCGAAGIRLCGVISVSCAAI